jgi:hypothetical protein
LFHDRTAAGRAGDSLKLEARSRVQTVVMAYESGLVVPASGAKDG